MLLILLSVLVCFVVYKILYAVLDAVLKYCDFDEIKRKQIRSLCMSMIGIIYLVSITDKTFFVLLAMVISVYQIITFAKNF